MLTVRPASLDWALAHARRFGDTDVMPVPFEYAALEHDWPRCRDHLRAQDLTRWIVRPHRTLLAPKGNHGFRPITQLDPLDFLLFSAVIRELASDLEAFRIPQAENAVFASRVALSDAGDLYQREFGYAAFVRRAEEILAAEPRYTYVATADIADFYPRIYHHRLEGALDAATRKESHVRVLMRFLRGWTNSESYGLPIGSAPTRLLAEVTLADTDQALLAQGVRFIRFVDDYRIFARSFAEAYRHIGFLAETLHRNHGLTLQAQKTTILPSPTYAERYSRTESDQEIAALHDRFDSLVDELGLGNPYEFINYENLSPDQRHLVDSLNLVELFHDATDKNSSVDLRLVRFILRRLTQLGDESLVGAVFDKIDRLYPIYRDVVEYVEHVDPGPFRNRQAIGGQLFTLLSNSVVSELPYYRLWTLDVFARSAEWHGQQPFVQLLAAAPDQFCRRKLILALGRAKQRHWFQAQWRTVFDEAPWPRRALIAGMSCLTGDTRRHWYRSIEPRLDLIERAIVKWALDNPFSD